MAEDCVFCKIKRGEIKGELLYQDDRAFVIKDIEPKAPVHLLIIPAQHFTLTEHLDAKSEPLMGHLFTIAREMGKRQGLSERGYRLVINQGVDGDQHVAHLHLHLLGGRRLGGMG